VLALGSWGQRRNPIRLVFTQHRPGHAEQLIRQRDHATFWWVRAISCDNQLLSPGACLVRYCITTRAPCTNSLRRYEFPRLLTGHETTGVPVVRPRVSDASAADHTISYSRVPKATYRVLYLVGEDGARPGDDPGAWVYQPMPLALRNCLPARTIAWIT
jgi:hypothetical protein